MTREMPSRRKDGQEYTTMSTISPILDENGNPIIREIPSSEEKANGEKKQEENGEKKEKKKAKPAEQVINFDDL